MTHSRWESSQADEPTFSVAMGTIQIFLCVFIAHLIAAESETITRDTRFPHVSHHALLNDVFPVNSDRSFDFPPYSGVFGPWPTLTPGFLRLAEFPPLLKVPNVHVYCDESRLTLLVDKSFGGVELSREEIRLGDGCYSNSELPNQLVFTYSFDQCGTTLGVQSGLEVFSNSLHFDIRKPPFTHLVTPSTMHVSCMVQSLVRNPNPDNPKVPSERKRSVNIKAMNPSWTNAADSLVYKRGQVVNLQVSARLAPNQQLFVQSCFASASPEPHTKPRHALILNKGCTVPSGSPHAVVRFVEAQSADVVNVALNTTYLMSEMYIHCSVLISDRSITTGSKSCNYDLVQSRWEELGRNVEVCKCCGSRCKGLSIKHLPDDAKAIVGTGPLMITDKEEPQEPLDAAHSNTMQSDAAAPDDAIASGASISRNERQGWSPPLGIVVVSQDPASRLTLWLPGQVQDEDDAGAEMQEPDPSKHPDRIGGQRQIEDGGNAPVFDLEIVAQVDGGSGLRRLRKEAEEAQRWLYDPHLVGTEVVKPTDVPVVAKHEPDHYDFKQMRDSNDATAHEAANPVQPVVRSKLQLSKSTDGSQSLSYEEEVVAKGGSSVGMEGPQRRKGLLSTFVDLLRRLIKAE